MTICTPWRVGASLNVLVEQVDVMCPGRSKASDGTIGDTAHQAEACSSQHNSCCVRYNGVWIIRARDITHDPAHGCDIQVLFDRIRASRDPRVRYLIFNRRICYPTARNGYAPWAWQPYYGDNPHDHHGHVSVFDSQPLYDSTQAWAIGGVTPPGVQPARARITSMQRVMIRQGVPAYSSSKYGNGAVYITDGTTAEQDDSGAWSISEAHHIGPEMNDNLERAGIPFVTVGSEADLLYLCRCFKKAPLASPPSAEVSIPDLTGSVTIKFD